MRILAVAMVGILCVLPGYSGSHSRRVAAGHLDGRVVAFAVGDGHQICSRKLVATIQDVYLIGPVSDVFLIDAWGKGPCSRDDLGQITLAAGDGQMTCRRRDRPAFLAGSRPPEAFSPSLLLIGAGATYRASRVGDQAQLQALQPSTGRVLWTAPLPDPQHQAFKAHTAAAGVVTNHVVYLAYVSDSRDPCTASG